MMIGGGRRGGHVPDVGGRRRAGVVALRWQDRQVVDGEDTAGRGAVAEAAGDRCEVAFELREALIRRARVPELGDPRPDARQRVQRPGQAGQGKPGREADVVDPRGDGDKGRDGRYGVELSGLAGGGGPEKVASGRAREGDVVQVEPERPGDEVSVVARGPPGREWASGNARRKAGPRREGAAHRHVTAPGRNGHLVLLWLTGRRRPARCTRRSC